MTRPLLVLVVGTAGSGKSTVARELANALPGAYLDKDRLANPFTEAMLALAGEEPGARDGSVFYKERVMPLEYEALLDVAADVASSGVSAILDAPFGAFFADKGFVTDAAARRGVTARLAVVRVTASKEQTRRQLVERGLPRDAWKLEHWDEFWGNQAAPAWEGVPVLEHANDGPLDVSALVAALQNLR